MKTVTEKKIFKCFLKTLSPVHVGCDEVYEPTGFSVDERAQQLVVFDPLNFISNLDEQDKSRFSEICSKGTVSSILEIFKFLNNQTAEGRMVAVCPDFLGHYNRTLSMSVANEKKVQQELNDFRIPRTAFRALDQRPYIPGSAVKGALRTAYLNGVTGNKPVPLPKGRRAAAELEKKLLKYDNIPGDPFRLVKVSDFQPVGDVPAKVVYGVNVKKKKSDKDARGLPLLFEVVLPGTLFQGVISVEAPLAGSKIKQPVAFERLFANSEKFYRKERNREAVELSRTGAMADEYKVDDGNESAAVLIRIGRHSGAESVTVDGYRNIRIMLGPGKNKYEDHATTVWMASDIRRPKLKKILQPFGWLKLTGLTQELENEFKEKERVWKVNEAAEHDRRRSKFAKRNARRKEAEEVKQQQALEAERKRKEEARRLAELEAMSPEERMVAEIREASITENRVVEIYNQLDEFSEEYQKKLAEALKHYWIGMKKWQKKQCSKKQLPKVKKVKSILGED